MDIHKPKPWRGWPEFLKEIGTIVIGVLIALGAEAVVQNLHEQRLSAEAEAAVRDEINVDITSLARRFDRAVQDPASPSGVSIRQEACVARRMDEIDALLDTAEDGKPFTPPAAIGGPFEPGLYTSRWTAATAGGRTSLLSSQEQRQFGVVYQALQHLEQREENECQAWQTLRALKGLHHLSPGMIDRQRIALSQARAFDGNILQAFSQAKFYAQRLGVKGDARLALMPGESGIRPVVCQPLIGASGSP